MVLSMCTKLQLIVMSCARKTIENRLPTNEKSINCKQMASTNVKMVDHVIITARTGMDGKLVVWVITMGKSCLQPCFPSCFGYCIFQWTRHPERLSYQRYIKELNCGHTLQSHDVVVLYRNNSIRTSSVTTAIN